MEQSPQPLRRTTTAATGDRGPSTRRPDQSAREQSPQPLRRTTTAATGDRGPSTRRPDQSAREQSPQPLRRTTTAATGDQGARARERRTDLRTQATTTPWMGVGRWSWKMITGGKRLRLKRSGKWERRIWLFGDSILRGLGKEIQSLTSEYYRIEDKCLPGANIRTIREKVRQHLSEMESEDLVVIEGGGNGLLDIVRRKNSEGFRGDGGDGEEKGTAEPPGVVYPHEAREGGLTVWCKEEVVNTKCVEQLENWACDGLQLWERMSWNQVWSRDGIHMSNVGKVWMAWNVAEWAQQRRVTRHREGRVEEECCLPY
ncbi:hypothetical protein GWK47_019535 [Chionoecetes opilio]|uniref:Uncharacterized protein n=1 Tax=Chionoecetes opilio TaxID=41210 RepID=A0A8J5CI18_CHIOP|nr:hypothetical protein GWK47_019535 [Chionoecetes opilio]